jgi:hypothetical protein
MEDIQIDIPTNASLVEKKEINEVVEADLENLIPKMVAIPSPTSLIPEEQKRIVDVSQLIPDDQYLDLLQESIENMRDDRKQVSEYVDSLADMVINDGDATTSTKEAFVNMVKIKSDINDKMIKALDIITRLKVKNTYAYSGAHLNAMQQNNFNIGENSGKDFDRKELIRAINKAKKQKKEK